jgi:hypothetical protein
MMTWSWVGGLHFMLESAEATVQTLELLRLEPSGPEEADAGQSADLIVPHLGNDDLRISPRVFVSDVAQEVGPPVVFHGRTFRSLGSGRSPDRS